MLANLLTDRFLVGPNPAQIVLVFFAYSFMGYLLECVVLTLSGRKIVIDRGFAAHLPFCIIYGFGAMLGYAILSPFQENWLLLFVVGAVIATGFEYMVAQVQLRLFGSLWWDYSEKPFNYKGILCLESTLGWGVIAILVVKVLHASVVGLVWRVPAAAAAPLAVLVLVAYVVDFSLSARSAWQNREETGTAELTSEDM